MTLVIDDEFKDLIPPLSNEEYAQLEASLLAEGCRDALVTWNDTLIDGHNRYAICQKHSLAFTTVQREFESREDVVVWMVRNQLARRNITTFVRGELALRMKDAIAALAKANQAHGQTAPGKNASVKFDRSVSTRAELAYIAEVSAGTLWKVEKVLQTASETVKQMARGGDWSVNRAYELTKALDGASAELIEMVSRDDIDDAEKVRELKRWQTDAPAVFDEVYRTGWIVPGGEYAPAHISAGLLDIQAALKAKSKLDRQLATDERRQRAASTPLPDGLYRCIVIDPPWPAQKIEREVRPRQTKALDYPTMTLEAIEALPISKLAYRDGCHLFVWTTHKFLPDALFLVEAWGFNYQCQFTWVKPTGMTPYSWMYNTEHVVFARRGDLALREQGLKLSFEAPVDGHSVKPDVFYERVIRATHEPRLDMFARRERDGFAGWGDEV